jgi:putative SOS response-associated peptidase YedK
MGKDSSGAARMINARLGAVHTLPAFREAMKLRRCLVPADVFYYSLPIKTVGGENHS